MRTLEQILEEMQRLPTKPDEGTHMIADELLVEALQVYAEYLADAHRLVADETRIQAQALISAYNQIEKWYA